MNIKEEQVSVIYHGADETPYTPNENNRHPFEYILFVGERHFYKNFDFFAKQCVPILKRHKELKVVCTGKPFNETEKVCLNHGKWKIDSYMSLSKQIKKC